MTLFMRRIVLSLILCLLAPLASFAQEMAATVSVNYQKVGGSDKQFYQTMEQSFQDFINNKRWTSDVVTAAERIGFNITIVINARPAADQFTASIQVSYARPIYGTGYTSPLLNINDNDFSFTYNNPSQLIDFTEASYTSNLTSVLAFYTLFVLGLDYDTFSPFGGNPYFTRAQNIANSAASQPELAGWKPDALRNRYWLVNDMTNSRYANIRQALYTYHRLGLDAMAQDQDAGRAKMVDALNALYKAYRDKPGSYFLQVFCNTKATEFGNAFSRGTTAQRTQTYQQLSEMDPTNQPKYGIIQKTN